MRIAASAGIDPIKFYDLTWDEAIIALKGKVDEWRYLRRNAFLSGMFKSGTKETDLYELPFDEELIGTRIDDDLISEYNQLREKLNG